MTNVQLKEEGMGGDRIRCKSGSPVKPGMTKAGGTPAIHYPEGWRARPAGLQTGNACWIGTAVGGHRRIMVVTGHLFQAVGCGAGIIIEKDQDFAVGLAGGLITLAAGLQAPC